MLRGKQLDEVIEQELQMILLEGFEKSPISHKALHSRLTAKGYISGGLSTLSSAERRELISMYISEQISPLNLKTKEQQLYVNKKTRQALWIPIKICAHKLMIWSHSFIRILKRL